MAGVPEEVTFASKPQLPAPWWIAHGLGVRAAFVAGDEVHGGRELRRGTRQHGMGYVMAVRANHYVVTAGSGRTVTAAAAAGLIPAPAWHRMRTGSGTKGTRHYDWAMLEVTSDDTPGGHGDGHSILLARQHPYTSPSPSPSPSNASKTPASDLDAGLWDPVTVPELLRLLHDTVIPPPRRARATVLEGTLDLLPLSRRG
ncbi:MAG: hypothetical protein ABSB59_41420 [Streptosporangiaceae bacterium]